MNPVHPPLLSTHEVFNQAPELVDYNLYAGNPALQEAVAREGASQAQATHAWLLERGGELGGRGLFCGRLARGRARDELAPRGEIRDLGRGDLDGAKRQRPVGRTPGLAKEVAEVDVRRVGVTAGRRIIPAGDERQGEGESDDGSGQGAGADPARTSRRLPTP